MEDNDDTDRRDIDKKRFRLDATINVAHIFATLGMVFTLFNWGSGVNSAQAVQAYRIETIKADRERDRAETLQALSEINRKLDKLADKK